MKDKYIVIICDFIGSTSKIEFIPHEKLFKILNTINDRYSENIINGFMLNPDALGLYGWELVNGDELKCVINKHFDDVPEMIRLIRTLFYPYKLRIALGFGDIFELNENINYLNGTAFKNARNAMDYLNEKSKKNWPKLYTYFSGFKNDSLLNAMYSMIDVLENKWSEVQWKRVASSISDIEDIELGNLLKLNNTASVQAISKSLNSANYKNISLAEKEIGNLLLKEV